MDPPPLILFIDVSREVIDNPPSQGLRTPWSPLGFFPGLFVFTPLQTLWAVLSKYFETLNSCIIAVHGALRGQLSVDHFNSLAIKFRFNFFLQDLL